MKSHITTYLNPNTYTDIVTVEKNVCIQVTKRLQNMKLSVPHRITMAAFLYMKQFNLGKILNS